MFNSEAKGVDYAKIQQQLKLCKSHTRSLYLIILITVLIFIFAKFEDRYWQVNLDYDGSAYITKDSWWGIKQETRPLKLIRGEWHFKSKNGEWLLLGIGDEDY